jgi:hypothetical protein
MSDPIKVLRNMPGQGQEPGYCFLSVGEVKAMYPHWTVKDNLGKGQECARTHPEAELRFYKLVDMQDDVYYLPKDELDRVLPVEQVEQTKANAP